MQLACGHKFATNIKNFMQLETELIALLKIQRKVVITYSNRSSGGSIDVIVLMQNWFALCVKCEFSEFLVNVTLQVLTQS